MNLINSGLLNNRSLKKKRGGKALLRYTKMISEFKIPDPADWLMKLQKYKLIAVFQKLVAIVKDR